MQLTTWTNANESAAAAAANQRKVQCGIIVSESCKQFLIMVKHFVKKYLTIKHFFRLHFDAHQSRRDQQLLIEDS